MVPTMHMGQPSAPKSSNQPNELNPKLTGYILLLQIQVILFFSYVKATHGSQNNNVLIATYNHTGLKFELDLRGE